MIGIINRYNRVMQSYYEFIVARLNGEEIKTNYRYYRSLVKRGIAGFIIFGGELKTVRDGIKKLQSHAALPLIISSDLEQGLGQQIAGGTLFPPAMAVAAAMLKYAKTPALIPFMPRCWISTLILKTLSFLSGLLVKTLGQCLHSGPGLSGPFESMAFQHAASIFPDMVILKRIHI
jgi:hypothetical protein